MRSFLRRLLAWLLFRQRVVKYYECTGGTRRNQAELIRRGKAVLAGQEEKKVARGVLRYWRRLKNR